MIGHGDRGDWRGTACGLESVCRCPPAGRTSGRLSAARRARSRTARHGSEPTCATTRRWRRFFTAAMWTMTWPPSFRSSAASAAGSSRRMLTASASPPKPRWIEMCVGPLRFSARFDLAACRGQVDEAAPRAVRSGCRVMTGPRLPARLSCVESWTAGSAQRRSAGQAAD
jgi:hypothetical protein